MYFVLGNLDRLFADIEKLDLRVSNRTQAAARLRLFRKELGSAEREAKLTSAQALQLNTSILELRKTLEAELRATYSYSLTPKKLDVIRLIEAPETLLNPDSFRRLPIIAQYDLSEAARCIAFEVPTAAAFHLMRATEAVLRTFYSSTVHRGRKAKMWAEIVADIRSRKAGKSHAVLLNHLDHIRVAFRNPTQHPELRYDINEVQDLWSVSVDVINRMAAHIK